MWLNVPRDCDIFVTLSMWQCTELCADECGGGGQCTHLQDPRSHRYVLWLSYIYIIYSWIITKPHSESGFPHSRTRPKTLLFRLFNSPKPSLVLVFVFFQVSRPVGSTRWVSCVATSICTCDMVSRMTTCVCWWYHPNPSQGRSMTTGSTRKYLPYIEYLLLSRKST